MAKNVDRPGRMSPTAHATVFPTEPLSLFSPSTSTRTFVTRYGELLTISPLILDLAPSADGPRLARNQRAADWASLCADAAVGGPMSSASPSAMKTRERRVPMRSHESNILASCKTLAL